MAHRESALLIGSAGFTGPPGEDGAVEIAHGIVFSFEGRGYATEVAAALVAFASNDARVTLIRAHTLPGAGASGRVLLKCGFRHVAPTTPWLPDRHLELGEPPRFREEGDPCGLAALDREREGGAPRELRIASAWSKSRR